MAVSNINNTNFTFAPITLNRDITREQNIENANRQISHIEREIEVRENYIDSNDSLIALKQSYISNLKENISARENYVDSNNQLINLLEENNCAREKLIAGNEKIIKLHQEQKQTLLEQRQTLLEQKENNLKQIELLESSKEIGREKYNILKNTNSQLQALLDGKAPSSSKSVKPIQTPKLPDLDEKTYKVSPLDTGFIADVKVEKETKLKEVSNEQFKRKSVINLKSDTLQKEKEFLAERGVLFKENSPVVTETLVRNMYKIAKADNSLADGEYDKAQKRYDKILSSNGLNNKTIDANYRPLNEQLRLAAQTYQNILKFEKDNGLDVTSNVNLTASMIATHIMDKHNVNKAEALDMIKNQFYYSEVSPKLEQGTLIKEQSAKLEDVVKKTDMAIDYHEKQIVKASSTDKAKDVTSTSKKDDRLSPTYRAAISHIPKFNSSILQSDNVKFPTISSPMQRYAIQSQKNILESILLAKIANVSKFV